VSRAVGRPVTPMKADRVWVGRWTFVRNIVPISSHFVLACGLKVSGPVDTIVAQPRRNCGCRR
jgi:hypothetical protein